jgi:hypothetical protein
MPVPSVVEGILTTRRLRCKEGKSPKHKLEVRIPAATTYRPSIPSFSEDIIITYIGRFVNPFRAILLKIEIKRKKTPIIEGFFAAWVGDFPILNIHTKSICEALVNNEQKP